MTKMQPTAAAALLALVAADAHHMTIKAAYRQLTGRPHEADGLTVQDLRDALTAAAERKVARKPKAAKEPRTVHLVTLAELPKGGKWGRVVRIAAWGRKGQPKRVVIRCECGAEREIATQDLFQVRHCSLKCKRADERGAFGLPARIAPVEELAA